MGNFDLSALLQDPAIYARLLDNLAMSPLDPAAALQQVNGFAQSGWTPPGSSQVPLTPPSPQPEAGPPPLVLPNYGPGQTMPLALPGQASPSMAAILRGGTSGNLQQDPNALARVPNAGSTFNEQMPQGVRDPNQDPSRFGWGAPGVQIMPGESGGMPSQGSGDKVMAAAASMLKGAGKSQQQQQPQLPHAGAVAPSNHWSPYQAGMFRIAPEAERASLWQILQGRA